MRNPYKTRIGCNFSLEVFRDAILLSVEWKSGGVGLISVFGAPTRLFALLVKRIETEGPWVAVQSIVKLIGHNLTAPHYVVVMISFEYPL